MLVKVCRRVHAVRCRVEGGEFQAGRRGRSYFLLLLEEFFYFILLNYYRCSHSAPSLPASTHPFKMCSSNSLKKCSFNNSEDLHVVLGVGATKVTNRDGVPYPPAVT